MKTRSAFGTREHRLMCWREKVEAESSRCGLVQALLPWLMTSFSHPRFSQHSPPPLPPPAPARKFEHTYIHFLVFLAFLFSIFWQSIFWFVKFVFNFHFFIRFFICNLPATFPPSHLPPAQKNKNKKDSLSLSLSFHIEKRKKQKGTTDHKQDLFLKKRNFEKKGPLAKILLAFSKQKFQQLPNIQTPPPQTARRSRFFPYILACVPKEKKDIASQKLRAHFIFPLRPALLL